MNSRIRSFMMFWLSGIAILFFTHFLMAMLILPIALLIAIPGIPLELSQSGSRVLLGGNGILGFAIVIVYVPAGFAWLLRRLLQKKDGLLRSVFFMLLQQTENASDPVVRQDNT